MPGAPGDDLRVGGGLGSPAGRGWDPVGTHTVSCSAQLTEELEQLQQSKRRLEGERRETESNWEAQIADILTW